MTRAAETGRDAAQPASHSGVRDGVEAQRVLIDQAGDAILVADARGVIASANQRAESLLGAGAGELVGRTIESLIEPEDLARRPLIHSGLRAGEVGAIERSFVRGDGTTLRMGISYSRLRDGRLLAIVRDVSEQVRRAEEERRKASLANTFTATIAKVGAASDLEEAASALLTGAAEVFGAQQGCAQLYATPTWPGFFVRQEGDVAEVAQRCTIVPGTTSASLYEGAPAQVIEDYLELDPSHYPLYDRMKERGLRAALAVPITADGRRIGSLHLDSNRARHYSESDLSLAIGLAAMAGAAIERARLMGTLQTTLEDLRHANVELAEAQDRVVQQERLSAIGQMAAGIAHDLNNALAPVVGFTELILNDPSALTPLQHSWLQLVHTGAVDAAGVVGRLREVYRPRRERDEYTLVDLNPLVEQVIALTRPKWRDDALAVGRTIEVVADPADKPILVDGNAAELREALTNLIFNAVDATLDKGRITLRVREEGERCVVSVRDTGMGMSEADRRRCLEPFFTTKGTRGTGLGLAMVHGTVQRHGGEMEVESALRLGTTFHLRLPVASQMRTEAGGTDGAANETGAAAKTRSLRVLLVDDEAAVREVMAAYLEADGHMVDRASSPSEAIGRVGRGDEYDVVITDRAMPGLSGEALAEWIKRRRPALPVIMVTGYGALMNAVGERPAAVDAVLGKPVTMGTLRKVLVSAVSEPVAA